MTGSVPVSMSALLHEGADDACQPGSLSTTKAHTASAPRAAARRPTRSTAWSATGSSRCRRSSRQPARRAAHRLPPAHRLRPAPGRRRRPGADRRSRASRDRLEDPDSDSRVQIADSRSQRSAAMRVYSRRSAQVFSARFFRSSFSLLAAPAFAQNVGTITGTVKDPQGLAIPGATVTLDNRVSQAAQNDRHRRAGTLYAEQRGVRHLRAERRRCPVSRRSSRWSSSARRCRSPATSS